MRSTPPPMGNPGSVTEFDHFYWFLRIQIHWELVTNMERLFIWFIFDEMWGIHEKNWSCLQSDQTGQVLIPSPPLRPTPPLHDTPHPTPPWHTPPYPAWLMHPYMSHPPHPTPPLHDSPHSTPPLHDPTHPWYISGHKGAFFHGLFYYVSISVDNKA